jgi:hypothetical protein
MGNLKPKSINLLLAILIIPIALLDGFLTYTLLSRKPASDNQPVEQTNTPNQEENDPADNTLNINDPLIYNLKYPSIGITPGYDDLYEYTDITVDKMSRTTKMLFASAGLNNDTVTYDPNNTGRYSIPASAVRTAYQALFGPDATYSDGTLTDIPDSSCVAIRDYDAVNQVYRSWDCGGGSDFNFSNEKRFIKAEQAGDKLYTYFYVQPYIHDYYASIPNNNDTVWLFRRQSESGLTPISGAPTKNFFRKIVGSESAAMYVIRTMMGNGEVDTYKFTFTKQSDGKYYYTSGNWETSL